MARRLFIKATHQFLVDTEGIEDRLKEIFDKLYDERNELQKEVVILRSKVQSFEGQSVGVNITSEFSKIDSGNSIAPPVKLLVDELDSSNDAADNNSTAQKAMSALKNLLKSMYPLRLNDEEMIRLATLSKLRSEIDNRLSSDAESTY